MMQLSKAHLFLAIMIGFVATSCHGMKRNDDLNNLVKSVGQKIVNNVKSKNYKTASTEVLNDVKRLMSNGIYDIVVDEDNNIIFNGQGSAIFDDNKKGIKERIHYNPKIRLAPTIEPSSASHNMHIVTNNSVNPNSTASQTILSCTPLPQNVKTNSNVKTCQQCNNILAKESARRSLYTCDKCKNSFEIDLECLYKIATSQSCSFNCPHCKIETR